MPEPASPFAAAANGVKVSVRLTPRAGRNRIEGPVADAQGRVSLKTAVTEVPEKGRANAALIKLLAKEWRLPKSAFTVIAGAADRRKTVLIAGDPPALTTQLTEWMRTRHG